MPCARPLSIHKSRFLINLRIPLPATPLFSHLYKSLGWGLDQPNSHQSRSLPAGALPGHRVTSHLFSCACRLFALSLHQNRPSLPLFSAAYSLFLQNRGVGTQIQIMINSSRKPSPSGLCATQAGSPNCESRVQPGSKMAASTPDGLAGVTR